VPPSGRPRTDVEATIVEPLSRPVVAAVEGVGPVDLLAALAGVVVVAALVVVRRARRRRDAAPDDPTRR
jgi:hypothetical protein